MYVVFVIIDDIQNQSLDYKGFVKKVSSQHGFKRRPVQPQEIEQSKGFEYREF